MYASNDSRIAALADAKDAALYFKYVLPLDPSLAFPEDQQSLYGWQRVMRNLLPPEMLDASAVHGLARPLITFITQYLMAVPDHFGIDLPEDELQRRRVQYFNELVHTGFKLAHEGGFAIDNLMVASDDGDADDTDAPQDPSVTLAKLKLVDTSRLSWAKLLELRQDEAAAARLRNLRLCLVKDYANKEINYIRDDLEKRIDDYARAVKEWDLDTRDSALSAVFSSKTFMATSGGLLAATLAGGPLATILAPAAATGMVFEAAGILIEIRKRRRKLTEQKDKDPVLYLVETRGLETT